MGSFCGWPTIGIFPQMSFPILPLRRRVRRSLMNCCRRRFSLVNSVRTPHERCCCRSPAAGRGFRCGYREFAQAICCNSCAPMRISPSFSRPSETSSMMSSISRIFSHCWNGYEPGRFASPESRPKPRPPSLQVSCLPFWALPCMRVTLPRPRERPIPMG